MLKETKINWFNYFGHEATGPEADELRAELLGDFSEVLASSEALLPEIEECKTFAANCKHCGWPGNMKQVERYTQNHPRRQA